MPRRQALTSETLTVSTTAISLTAAKLTKEVTVVTVQVESNSIRYWTSATAPTSTNGILATDGTKLEFDIAQAHGLRMIRAGAADAKAHVEYIREFTT